MKALIVEDDFLSRSLLSTILNKYGTCDATVNGEEALKEFRRALVEKEPYDLVCLDIMMPVLDGQETLLQIRRLEEDFGLMGAKVAKAIMITAIDDSKAIMKAFRQGQCDAYLIKPLDRDKLINHLKDLGLIENK